MEVYVGGIMKSDVKGRGAKVQALVMINEGAWG
jgi:hypothetical protein